jgi:hypothetical protein
MILNMLIKRDNPHRSNWGSHNQSQKFISGPHPPNPIPIIVDAHNSPQLGHDFDAS